MSAATMHVNLLIGRGIRRVRIVHRRVDRGNVLEQLLLVIEVDGWLLLLLLRLGTVTLAVMMPVLVLVPLVLLLPTVCVPHRRSIRDVNDEFTDQARLLSTPWYGDLVGLGKLRQLTKGSGLSNGLDVGGDVVGGQDDSSVDLES